MLHTYQKELKGKKIGIVFGCYAPLHQGHLDVIFKAKKECDGGVIVIVCGYDNDRGGTELPLTKRYKYVREFFSNDDLVSVYSIDDTELGLPEYPNGWNGWLVEFNRIFNIAVKDYEERIWYVGEEDYKLQLEKRGEKAVLLDRKQNPISATLIRQNPLKYWNKIALPFRNLFSKNILITGTASEGKTTLVQDLGKYFNAPYSYEYGREYMEKYCLSDWELSFEHFLAFLTGQFELNKSLIESKSNNGLFIADTDSLVTNMYAKHYSMDSDCCLTDNEYQTLKDVAYQLASKSKWDIIFLFPPHGVFVDDHSRFMKHSDISERDQLFTILSESIKEVYGFDKVVILDKSYNENFEIAKERIKDLLKYE